jgi:hypothetical protein
MNGDESGFRFEIIDVKEWEMTNGEPAFVLFLNITNLHPKARLITLSLATYVTSDGEQLEQDLWVTGYLILHGRINGNAHRKSGLVFYKSHLSKISTGDSLSIEVEVPDRAKKVSLRFEKEALQDKMPCSQRNMPWAIRAADAEDFDVKPTPRIAAEALTKRIERLEAFEDKFGIVLDKLSVNVRDDYHWLTIASEIHQAGSGSLVTDIALVAVVYDSEGSIIITGNHSFSARTFSGFDVFSMALYAQDIGILATRIRIFPKAY